MSRSSVRDQMNGWRVTSSAVAWRRTAMATRWHQTADCSKRELQRLRKHGHRRWHDAIAGSKRRPSRMSAPPTLCQIMPRRRWIPGWSGIWVSLTRIHWWLQAAAVAGIYTVADSQSQAGESRVYCTPCIQGSDRSSAHVVYSPSSGDEQFHANTYNMVY